MLKIRLMLTGRRNQRSYRIVIAEARSKRNGKHLEKLGNWDPANKELKLNKERYLYWLNHGAQPTERVKKLYKQLS